MPRTSSLSLSQYRRAAALTREHTGFGSFAELLTARSPSPAGYRPVLYTTMHPARPRRPRTAEQLAEQQALARQRAELADLYDRAQDCRGDARRAVRL